eukprot:358299-Chlamydomonas_euryale.AAC.13
MPWAVLCRWACHSSSCQSFTAEDTHTHTHTHKGQRGVGSAIPHGIRTSASCSSDSDSFAPLCIRSPTIHPSALRMEGPANKNDTGPFTICTHSPANKNETGP